MRRAGWRWRGGTKDRGEGGRVEEEERNEGVEGGGGRRRRAEPEQLSRQLVP